MPTRKPADGPGTATAWVLRPLRHDLPGQRAVVLHERGCWVAPEDSGLIIAETKHARVFLRGGWAVPREACHPTLPET
ncbi:hypothetical protein ACIQJX_33110 [Streptomyces griseoviridis]